MALSLLLHRRFSFQRLKGSLFFFLSHHNPKPRNFSSLSSVETKPTTEHPKPSSLSARMSFVFDQIDSIERDRSQKDETLQRIRAWRESKNKDNTSNNLGLGLGSLDSKSNQPTVSVEVKKEVEKRESGGLMNKAVELVHPWPEWIELMERLVQQNYFDHKRKDEDKMVEELGFSMSEVADEAFDFTRDWKTVQTACLNFGRDRFDILRSLSRQDIQVLVGYGCPSTDKKVIFSAKLLRKHSHLDEGDVCSSCSLRSSCERAYLLTNKEDEARTIDIMRILLIYGFDPMNESVVNVSLLKKKSLKTVVRKLLHQVVKLSAVPIDPNLPPPVIKKPPPKVKQPPPPPKKRVGRDDIEMKKGDWLCPKCDFMNFAKNMVCLQCDANRPQRQLLPGEWECPECNFLNYRRNVVCFHCECKRPPDEFMENQMQERSRGPVTRGEKVSRTDVSNAWNFDFDDNESDGADVAAFEYADSQKLDEDFPLGKWAEGEKTRRADDGFQKNSRPPMAHERGYSDHGPKRPGTGFDDFDDEEDDLESYELDTQSRDQVQKTSIDFSELEVDSDSEGTNDNRHAQNRTSSPRNNKALKPMRRKPAFSGSEDDELDFDSDKELPVHPNWRSSHVADSRQRTRGRGAITYGSDEDLGLSSGSEGNENFRSRQNEGNKRGSNKRKFGKRSSYDSEDEPFSGSDSDHETSQFRRDNRGNKGGFDRRNGSKGRGGFNASENSRFKSRGTSDRMNPSKDRFDRSAHGSRGNDRGFQSNEYNGHRENARGDSLRNFKNPKGENFGNQRRGRFNSFDNSLTRDSYFDDDRHNRPRENVR